MPRRNVVKIKLPMEKPDCCVECPLLGLIPKDHARPKNSKETLVCLGTMEALTKRGSKVRASLRDSHHPLKRPCDGQYHAWLQLEGGKKDVSVEAFNKCRVPYEGTLQFKIKFHR